MDDKIKSRIKCFVDGDIHYSEFSIVIEWSNEHGEFGEILIEQDNEGKIKIGSEYMSADFVKQVLASIVDNAQIEW